VDGRGSVKSQSEGVKDGGGGGGGGQLGCGKSMVGSSKFWGKKSLNSKRSRKNRKGRTKV